MGLWQSNCSSAQRLCRRLVSQPVEGQPVRAEVVSRTRDCAQVAWRGGRPTGTYEGQWHESRGRFQRSGLSRCRSGDLGVARWSCRRERQKTWPRSDEMSDRWMMTPLLRGLGRRRWRMDANLPAQEVLRCHQGREPGTTLCGVYI
jgi:hypothetical protein